MTKLVWDATGERRFETGVDHGVLYVRNALGNYPLGVPWNGLTAVTESPSGAEATAMYADNIKYLNLISVEEFGGTIEAYTYPLEFEACDGTAAPQVGIAVGQQRRKTFGLAYRTRIGNDVEGDALGYKLHLVYGAQAQPSEKARATVNDSPEAVTFSWTFTTTPIDIPGTDTDGKAFRPSATITIDSTAVAPSKLTDLENILFGTPGADPYLPLPAEVFALFAGSGATLATPTAPTYNAGTKVITIPTVTGVIYKNALTGTTYTAGAQPAITVDTVVQAVPAVGYKFPVDVDVDWGYDF